MKKLFYISSVLLFLLDTTIIAANIHIKNTGEEPLIIKGGDNYPNFEIMFNTYDTANKTGNTLYKYSENDITIAPNETHLFFNAGENIYVTTIHTGLNITFKKRINMPRQISKQV